MTRKCCLIAIVLLAIWIVTDFAVPRRSSLIHFDGQRVGKLETEMWRSYYGHQPVSLFAELVQLLREQYHVAFWRAGLGAYEAARAAVVFQRGRNRAEYELALPNLVNFYSIIRRDSDIAFSVTRAARLELERWIIHRERTQHSLGDLERSLAALQSEIYQRQESLFTAHAHARAEAMLLRDARAEAGGVSEQDWSRIHTLLDLSWVSLRTTAAQ